MKAISIRQPWAGLTVLGLKKIETRNRQTNYRGLIAIHAGKTVDEEAMNFFMGHGKWKSFPAKYMSPRGAIIAVADMVDIKRYTSNEHFAEDDNRHLCKFFEATKFGWIWGKITPLEVAIPWRGMPGLFEVEI